MTIKERIFNNLSERNKVELSAQKVELGLIDDFLKKKTLLNEYSGIMGEYEKSKNDSVQMSKALKGGVKRDILNALKYVDKIKSSSNDLGLKLPQNVISLEKDFNKALLDIDRIKN
jgi:hypothetical protein